MNYSSECVVHPAKVAGGVAAAEGLVGGRVDGGGAARGSLCLTRRAEQQQRYYSLTLINV